MQGINFIGTWTLYTKEVHRFIKVYNQTLLAPVVTSLLFLAVFNLALGNHVAQVGEVPFAPFMASGLIIMAVVQNAFANTSSSFTMGKVLGTLIDYLIPPLSAGELIFASALAGITRGLCVGLLVYVSLSLFIPLSLHSFFYTSFHILAASLLLALLGLLAGIISETFDQMAAVTSYVITPLAFLSGTFYSVQHLPPFWQQVSHLNPFFYMIDGFRYGITGHHDSNLTTGILYLTAMIVVVWTLNHVLISKGYRIKH